MGLGEVVTLSSLMRKRSVESTSPAGTSQDVETGIAFLRNQDEESYKVMIAPVLAYFLTQLVLHNDKLPVHRHNSGGAFCAQTPPDISIKQYLDRIIKYTPCSAECFVVALVFMDRLVENTGIRVNSLNVHRILITSVMIAAKMLDDSTYNNKYYSHVAGIAVKELNALECKFLSVLNYNLYISQETFAWYRFELEHQLVKLMFNSTSGKANDSRLSEARDKAKLLTKRLRRSRSFNNGSPEKKLFNWRKRRSSSFTLIELPAGTTPYYNSMIDTPV